MSSPLQMAHKECCNCQSDGTCFGLQAAVPADAWLGVSAWFNGQQIDCSCLPGRKFASIVREPRRFRSFKEVDRFLDKREGKPGYRGLPKLCPCFERSVMPLVKYRPEWEDAVFSYNLRRVQYGLEAIGERAGKLCHECGGSVAGKAKYCPKCRKARQRAKRRDGLGPEKG